jgi:hypothetical protein
MTKKTAIGMIAFSLATAATAFAGLFKIEVPAELQPADVLDPTPAVAARLDA